MPFCLSARAAKQKTSVGESIGLSRGVHRRVLDRPCGCKRRRPLAVAGDFARCVWMLLAVRNGMLSKNPRLAARMSVCCGGQKKA